MKITLAFDVYGTLIDTAGVVTALRKFAGPDAEAFSRTWRDKQLEYSFRRGLMRRYENFAICTRDALEYTCAHFGLKLSDADKTSLLGIYPRLPAFADAADGLRRLNADDFALYAFSNGTASAVDTLLVNAGIRECFAAIVSVDDLATFKPNPDVYVHFLRVTGAHAPSSWLISGNPFDVIGAVATGMNGAWVKRDERAVFDPWGIEPTLTVTSLAQIGERILGHGGTRAP
jgi:2-haloacid dehalogenase